LTLAVVAALYATVSATALLVASPAELAAAEAPLTLVYRHATGHEGALLNGLAVCATVNGILAQIVMVSRLLFGMAEDGFLPRPLALVWPRTRTPVVATLVTALAVLTLSISVPIEPLARITSLLLLLVFVAVNLALLRLKIGGEPAPAGTFQVPLWVPAAGVAFSLLPLAWELFRLLTSLGAAP
jgi:amino acid transporter